MKIFGKSFGGFPKIHYLCIVKLKISYTMNENNNYVPLVWFLNDIPTDYNEVIKGQSASAETMANIEEEHERIVQEGID